MLEGLQGRVSFREDELSSIKQQLQQRSPQPTVSSLEPIFEEADMLSSPICNVASIFETDNVFEDFVAIGEPTPINKDMQCEESEILHGKGCGSEQMEALESNIITCVKNAPRKRPQSLITTSPFTNFYGREKKSTKES